MFLIYGLFYFLFAIITVAFMDIFQSSLFKLYYTASSEREENMLLLYLILTWPFVIALYILLIPVVAYKALYYTFKGHKEWL